MESKQTIKYIISETKKNIIILIINGILEKGEDHKPSPAQWLWSSPCQPLQTLQHWQPIPSWIPLRSFLLAFWYSSLSLFLFLLDFQGEKLLNLVPYIHSVRRVTNWHVEFLFYTWQLLWRLWVHFLTRGATCPFMLRQFWKFWIRGWIR